MYPGMKRKKNKFYSADYHQFRCAVQLPISLVLKMESHLSKKYRAWLQVELYPLLVHMDIGLKDQDSSPALPTRPGRTCHQLVVESTVHL